MRWAFVNVLLFSCSCCVAQYYETYSPANGLVDARVNRIIQDGNGRLFFLTRDGISIFDGQRFINHTKVGNTNIGIVNDALLQPDGSIEMATFSGDWIRCFANKNSPEPTITRGIGEVSHIIAIARDERLIVSNLGLFHIKNGTSTKLKLHQNSNNGRNLMIEKTALAGDHIVFNYYLKKDSLVFVCDTKTGNVMDSLVVPTIYDIVADGQGHVYLCTAKGIVQFNAGSLRLGKLQPEKFRLSEIIPPGFIINTIFFDRQGNAWLIGANGSCICVDRLTSKATLYSTSNGLLTGVRSMYQDNENNYWFIAPGIGVQKLLQTNYEIVSTIGDEITGQVQSFNTTEDGGIFIAQGSKLLLSNNERVDVPAALQHATDPVFYWQKKWWTYKDATTLVSDKQNVIIATPEQAGGKLFYPSPAMSTDREKNLLLSGNHISVIQKNYAGSTLPLPYFADNIVADEENNYWVFCRSNDIVKLKMTNGQLQRVGSFIARGIEPRFALHWRRDTFWIATRYRGVLIAKLTGNSLQLIGQLDRDKGLSNDFAETLLRIDERRVAVGTASGLDIVTIEGADTLVENISARINHFEPVVQLTRDVDGILYARTENLQLFRYNPAAGTVSGFRPAAWFSMIRVDGTIVEDDQTTFNFRQNNFSFSVTAPSFTDNRNITFRFSLTRGHNEWKQHGSKPDFEINNLSPGRYQLTVQINYPGRIYTDQQVVYHFTIRPPFWKTWWFLALLIASILFTAYYLARSYFKRQLHKQRMLMEKELAIEQERNRMARELHDGLGSMLSGIKHSFAAMKNRLSLAGKEELVFHSNIDKLNESILELRNISHSMASESLLKYGLENSLNDYCQNLNLHGQPVISFTAIGTSDMKLSDEQSFHLFRIVQELLQNCIKHAGASQVILQLSFNQKRLYITVEDDGKGFEWNNDLNKGLGLKNIETRVKILKGKMDYRTAPEKGTSVLVEIPCEQKH